MCVERAKRVKSEVRLACGSQTSAAGLRLACGSHMEVKHARKAPQNPVPTALSTRFQHAFNTLQIVASAYLPKTGAEPGWAGPGGTGIRASLSKTLYKREGRPKQAAASPK